MHKPLISILIPYKNTSVFLPQCLSAILAQSYTHWEVLAINDHSTDGSEEILTAYAKTDPRIRCYPNQGKGIIAALRTAYTQSRGELITRMDSDDIMAENKLEVLANNLITAGLGHIAIGKVKYFSGLGISEGYAKYEAWLNHLTETATNYLEIYKECVIPSPCWMVFRADLDRCQAFTPDRYPEDYDLTFRFYENGISCIPCSEVLHHWRDYPTRTSRTSVHYAQNYFLDIKLFYFLKLDHDPARPLVIWGAGNKGKTIAAECVRQKIAFYWLCDNPKKIGKKIYGQELQHYSYQEQLKNPQSIITVANAEAQIAIRSYLGRLGQLSMLDYFFFC